MDRLITICVSSFNRPKLLKEAIESCLRQSYRPLEIIVGDDSLRDHARFLEETIRFDDGVTFRYEHHAPALGEAKNVDGMLRSAKGERLVLLHDDDLLCDDALVVLDRAWSTYPGVRCVFGKYLIVDASGDVVMSKTLDQNEKYGRTAANEGRQDSGIRVGLQQQFPHNGYLIETRLAREVGYRSRDEVGLCADFDFGIRVGGAAGRGGMAYVDRYVSKYRLSFPSTLRANPDLGEHRLFRAIQAMPFDAEAARYREQALHRIAQGAALSAAFSRDLAFLAWVMASRFYRGRLISGRTALCLAALISPALATRIWSRRQGRGGVSGSGPMPTAA